MNKLWERPITTVQKFEANEYVAACGDGGVWYNFTCDAGRKNTSYYIMGEDGKNSHYHPCGTTHEASSQDSFVDGKMYSCTEEYVPYYPDYPLLGGEIVEKHEYICDVIIWRGPYNNNTHCTTNLDMASWTTAKS